MNISLFGAVKMGASQTADARFLRRILMGLVVLTLATGGIAAYASVGAMSAQRADLCTASALICTD